VVFYENSICQHHWTCLTWYSSKMLSIASSLVYLQWELVLFNSPHPKAYVRYCHHLASYTGILNKKVKLRISCTCIRNSSSVIYSAELDTGKHTKKSPRYGIFSLIFHFLILESVIIFSKKQLLQWTAKQIIWRFMLILIFSVMYWEMHHLLWMLYWRFKFSKEMYIMTFCGFLWELHLPTPLNLFDMI
jgi:hypothetical protein